MFRKKYVVVVVSETAFRKTIFSETIFAKSIFCNNCHFRKVICSFSVGKMATFRNRFKMKFLQDLRRVVTLVFCAAKIVRENARITNELQPGRGFWPRTKGLRQGDRDLVCWENDRKTGFLPTETGFLLKPPILRTPEKG